MSNNIKFDTLEDKKLVWHTTSHILANAIMRLFPTAKFGIGPAIDTGFYYDIDVDHRFTEEDLEKVKAIEGVTDASRFLTVNASLKDDTDVIAIAVLSVRSLIKIGFHRHAEKVAGISV